MTKSSINLTSLDFDTLKSTFKTYLKTQSVFKDYDFEGSNINVLLDVLSYNTYMNSFYLNMALNESFLDTAQLRNSVVSHAKEINYTPASAKSAKALVNIEFLTSGIFNNFEMPRGTQFSGTNSNGTYVFTTDRNIVVQSPSSTFTFNNVELYEGTYISEVFIVDNNKNNQRFILSNDTVDISSIEVQVIENNGQNITEFTQKINLYDLTSSSNIYFLQAAQDGLYEIVFGDDAFGRKPLNGATIVVNYRITSGSLGSSVTEFTIDRDLSLYNGGLVTDVLITTISQSTNGSDAESIESIRFRAPKSFQTLDRAVTNEDYKNIILANFNEIKDINVYGGDTLTSSPQYGKVYIAPTTNSGDIITSQMKSDIIDFLSNKKVVSIQIEIIDPDYVYLIPSITSTIDYNTTSLTPSGIKSLISSAITNFNNNNLKKFDTTFRYSKFIEAIDNSDASILGTKVDMRMYKQLLPDLDQSITLTSSFSTSFNNGIVPGTITGSSFLMSDGNTYQLTDYNPNNDTFIRTSGLTSYEVTNSTPNIYLKQITTNNTESYNIIGSVDYETGNIDINSITVVDFLNSPGILVYAKPTNVDVIAKYNNVIELDIPNLSIAVVSK